MGITIKTVTTILKGEVFSDNTGHSRVIFY